MPISTIRFLQVYIIQGLLTAVILFIGYKVIKRNPKKRINQIFALFFIMDGGALIINMLYAPIDVQTLAWLATVLNIFTYYFGLLGLVFLLLFVLIIDKSEKVINTSKQILLIAAFGIALAFLFFIPDGATVNITAANVQESPIWSLTFILWGLAIIGIGLVLTFLFSIRIYKKFEDKTLSQKWKFFIIGVGLLWITPIMMSLTNYMAPLNPTTESNIRLFSGLIQLVLIVIGAVLTYYGVGKQV